MDEIGESVEIDVNEVMQSALNFHDVKKIVVWLGPNPNQKVKYLESGDVGEIVMHDFCIDSYLNAPEEKKIAMLRETCRQALDWISTNHDDAGFVERTKSKLPWLNQTGS